MSKKKATAISLPLNRTAKIMTSAVGVESVNQDIVALATKATEIFLMDFARRAYDQSSDEEFISNVLEYNDIHKLVHSDSRYDFLADSIPERIKFADAYKLYKAALDRNKKPDESKEDGMKEEESSIREEEKEAEISDIDNNEKEEDDDNPLDESVE